MLFASTANDLFLHSWDMEASRALFEFSFAILCAVCLSFPLPHLGNTVANGHGLCFCFLHLFGGEREQVLSPTVHSPLVRVMLCWETGV